MKPKVLHCVDDPNMGGVNFALQSLCRSPLQNDVEFTIQYIDFSRAVKLDDTPDIVCLHGASNWRNLFNVLRFKLTYPKVKLVLQEHHYSDLFVVHQIKHPQRFYLMLKLNYWLMDKVVAIAPSQQQWMLSNRLVPKDKISLLGQGRDLSEFTPKPKDQAKRTGITAPPHLEDTSSETTVPVIAAYGRFHYQKGFDLLIEAMALVNLPCTLKIAGEGDLSKELNQLSDGKSNIELVGKVDNIPEFLNQVDAVVIPSRWEPFGLIFIESLAMNKAIISSQVDGLGDQVNQHRSHALTSNDHLPAIQPIASPVTAESIAESINQFLSQTASSDPFIVNETTETTAVEVSPDYINHWKQQQWQELQQAWKSLFKQLLADK